MSKRRSGEYFVNHSHSPSSDLLSKDNSSYSEQFVTGALTDNDPESLILSIPFQSKPYKSSSFCSDVPKTIKYSKANDRESEKNFSNKREEHLILTRRVIESLTELKVICRGDWKKITSKISKIHGIKFCQRALKTAYKLQVMRKKDKIRFNKEEDNIIISSVKDYGKNWQYIAQSFSKDTCPMAIRNRYYKLTRKDRSYTKSVKARVDKKRERENLGIGDGEVYDLGTLVKDIEFQESPTWLAEFKKMK